MAEKLKSFYFRHDENAANDLKVMTLRSQLAMEGYGIYWFIVEQLSMAGGKMPMKMIPMLAAVMQTTPDKAFSVVRNYELFVVDEDGFFSERLNKELDHRGMLSEAGRIAGLKSAEGRKAKGLGQPSSNDRLMIDEPVEERKEDNTIQDERTEQIHGAIAPDELRKMPFDFRKEYFKRQVIAEGGLIFTRKMLDNFTGYWTEPNGAKNPKMKWEVQRDKSKNGGYELKRRLLTWATQNLDNIVCYLTDEEKTIRSKQLDFRNSLIPFFKQYPKEMMTEFYRHWTQAENKPVPVRIRWEAEEFWDLPQRLSQWSSRNSQGIPQRHENVAR